MGFRNPLNFPPGSITGSMLAADSIDGKTITGAFIRTAATGLRWEIDSPGFSDEIRGYTGNPGEIDPASLTIAPGGAAHVVSLKAPKLEAHEPAELQLAAIDAATGEWVLFSNGGGRFVNPDTGVTYGGVDTSGRSIGRDGLFSMSYAGTTDASGFLIVNHTAGFTPLSGWAITGNPASSNANFWGIDALTLTTVRLRFTSAAAFGGLAGTAVVGRLFLVRP